MESDMGELACASRPWITTFDFFFSQLNPMELHALLDLFHPKEIKKFEENK